MKLLTALTLIGLSLLCGCASSPKPAMPTFKEAVADTGDVDSGWYAKQNRENVYVDVQNPRQKSEESEKKAYELQREADYKQHQIDQLQYENTLLRVRGNYKLEKQVNGVQGFDNQNNPIIRQKTVNPEPQERIEGTPTSAIVRPVPPPQHPAQPWQQGEYDSYNEKPAAPARAPASVTPPPAPAQPAPVTAAPQPAAPSPAAPAAQAAPKADPTLPAPQPGAQSAPLTPVTHDPGNLLKSELPKPVTE